MPAESEFWESIAAVIRAAASSPLGLVALLIIILGFVALRAMKDLSPMMKFSTFIIMFVGGIVLFYMAGSSGPESTPEQIADLTGNVMNLTTYEPVENAQVWIQGYDRTARTNETGYFLIRLDEHLQGDPLVLYARHSGYRFQPVTIPRGRSPVLITGTMTATAAVPLTDTAIQARLVRAENVRRIALRSNASREQLQQIDTSVLRLRESARLVRVAPRGIDVVDGREK